MPVTTGMSLSQVKAGRNFILSDYATGYANAMFVGKLASPLASVPERSGSTIRFDDSCFEEYDDTRAYGGPFKEIQNGYSSDGYILDSKGLSYKVPEEYQEEAALGGLQLGQIAVDSLMEAEALKIEIEQAAMVRNASNYTGFTATLSGTSQFSDTTNSVPDTLIDAAMLSIASATGRRGNLMLGGAQVGTVLRRHPRIVAQFYPTSNRTLTDENLAEFFNVKKVIFGEAVWRNPATNAMEFIWGKDLALLYVDPRAWQGTEDSMGAITYTPGDARRRRLPAKFYTYVLQNRPSISNPYWEEHNDSWYYKIKFERQHKVVSGGAGYLFKNAVA